MEIGLATLTVVIKEARVQVLTEIAKVDSLHELSMLDLALVQLDQALDCAQRAITRVEALRKSAA